MKSTSIAEPKPSISLDDKPVNQESCSDLRFVIRKSHFMLPPRASVVNHIPHHRGTTSSLLSERERTKRARQAQLDELLTERGCICRGSSMGMT